MNTPRGFLFRCLVALGVAVLWARGAEAALMTTSGEAFTGVDITLAMSTATDAGAGTTTLSFEISLGADAAADWQIVGFTVIREWGEGAFHGTGSPTGWSVTAYDDFVNWKAHTAGSEIPEETTVPAFTYAYFGDAPAGQFYRYLVSQDGGTPFQLISADVTAIPPAVVIPEPTAAALLVMPLAALLYRRRT
jgi:hypothetical protein